MTHTRRLLNAAAAGADMEKLTFTNEYACNGCRIVYPWAQMLHLQGQAFGPMNGGVSDFPLTSWCAQCLITKPISALLIGLELPG